MAGLSLGDSPAWVRQAGSQQCVRYRSALPWQVAAGCSRERQQREGRQHPQEQHHQAAAPPGAKCGKKAKPERPDEDEDDDDDYPNNVPPTARLSLDLRPGCARREKIRYHAMVSTLVVKQISSDRSYMLSLESFVVRSFPSQIAWTLVRYQRAVLFSTSLYTLGFACCSLFPLSPFAKKIG